VWEHNPRDLAAIDASTLAAGNQSFTFMGQAAFTAAGSLRLEFDGVEYDRSGERQFQPEGSS
jgi:hypothetical protein